MPLAINLTPEKRFFGLFVGEKSSGKTVAEASFTKPIDFLDFDGRIRGLLGAPWINLEGISHEYFPPKEPGLIERLDKKLELYNTMFKMGQPLPKTIVLDSLTSECAAFIMQSIPLTHMGGKGKVLGTLNMAGPEDYGFEATAAYNVMAFLKSIPVENIIMSAHIVPTFGKADPSNPYSETVQVGEKLSVRDKIGANMQIHFDHVFRFGRRETAGRMQFYVKFWSEIACTSFPNMPMGEVDITGKNFYETMMSLVKSSQEAGNNLDKK